MSTPDRKSRKKPYSPPVVTVYGNVRKLTQNLGGTGKNDNMSSSTTKTGL
jgi:hypothetical protein